jgi:hypothetical protein
MRRLLYRAHWYLCLRVYMSGRVTWLDLATVRIVNWALDRIETGRWV